LNPPDIRSYEGVAFIIKKLGIVSVNLLSNNPDKVKQLKRYGIKVNKMVPILIKPTRFTRIHLKEKEEKLGHRGLITRFH
jgi:3,4-dihydroxy 2-butanone 4-phosphate synthase/GTP cyclohydrolase II